MTTTAAPPAPPAGPAQAENTGPYGTRQYVHPVSGARYPSVTTIIKGTSGAGGLVAWSGRLAAEFAVDHPETWQPVLATLGRDEAVKLIAKASDRYRDARGEIGTLIHAVVEAMILDIPLPSIPDEAVARLDRFMEWVTDYDVEFWMSELTVCCPAVQAAGTLDAGATLGRCGGRRILVDVKSGKSVQPSEVGLQLAAYQHPGNEVWGPRGTILPMPEVDGVAYLHLTDERYEFVETKADDEAWEDFAAACRLYRRHSAGRRNLIGRIRRDDDPWFVEDVPSLNRCWKALDQVGLTTLEQLAEFSEEDLGHIDGIGPKGVAAIRAAIVACGVAP